LSERPARRSPFPAILVIAVIICLIGGLGALAWSQRTVIAGLLSGFGSGPQDVAAPQPVPAPPETGVAPAPPVASPPSASGAPSADEIAPEPPATDDGAAGRARAVLYEQPVDATAAVAAVGAAVDWRLVEDGAGGAEINAEIEVPERGMTIRLVIRLNSDADLPASHLVEVGIDTPADFADKGIRDVPGLILKADENQRGEPLIAAAIKVADGLFWIALSAEETDVARNLQLLREGSWIDLRLLYETGRGAILSFEKGPRGREVFENAFAAWDTG
jgi:hypothetical protein